MDQVNALKKRKQYRAALALLDEILGRKPGLASAIGQKAHVLHLMGRTAEGLETLSLLRPAAGYPCPLLCEAFLAGCCEKAEDVDDEAGDFSVFVQQLHSLWVNLKRQLGGPADAIARHLANHICDDDYGLCHGIEERLGEILNDSETMALIAVLQERHAATRVIKALHVARCDVDGYLSTCGHPLELNDYVSIAKMLQRQQKPQVALDWLERGLVQTGDLYERLTLARYRRAMLADLGRLEEARESAWQEFVARPHEHAFEELMKYVPAAEHDVWARRVVVEAARAPLGDRIRLLV
ncbi:MAG: hypothetical protein ACYCW6_04360, partial [Candidatus Xenobia bacterium]